MPRPLKRVACLTLFDYLTDPFKIPENLKRIIDVMIIYNII